MPPRKKVQPKATPAAEYCGNCQFYVDDGGICRRGPGTVVYDAGDFYTVQPIKEPDDWCGDHKMKGLIQ